jgi:hypothetical protein
MRALLRCERLVAEARVDPRVAVGWDQVGPCADVLETRHGGFGATSDVRGARRIN